MRLGRVSKQRAAGEAELAVVRLAALKKRSGWVPRVPDVAATAADEETAVREPVEPVAAAGFAIREPVGSGAAVREPAGSADDSGHAGDEVLRRPSGRHRRTTGAVGGSATTDRLPLPVRALIEKLPAGVRDGGAAVERGQAIVIVLVILLGVVSTALLTGLGRPKVSAVEPSATMTVRATGTPAPGTDQHEHHDEPADSGQPVELVVHVVGKVANAGIVTLPAGARVVDAIEAAGGADDDADLTPLNLARPLVDGEQVAVGIDPPPGNDQPVAGNGTAAGPGPALVNINTATADQLETLPGIGPALAAQILDWRSRNGAFTAIEELQEVSGIGPKKFAGLADLVTV